MTMSHSWKAAKNQTSTVRMARRMPHPRKHAALPAQAGLLVVLQVSGGGGIAAAVADRVLGLAAAVVAAARRKEEEGCAISATFFFVRSIPATEAGAPYLTTLLSGDVGNLTALSRQL